VDSGPWPWGPLARPLGRRPEPIDRRGPVLSGAECALFATRGVISNHPDLADQLRPFSVPFLHVPAIEDIRPRGRAAPTRLVARKQVSGGLSSVHVDLARHMQIRLSQFVAEAGCALINIHHSFLPAFIGVAPHRRAAVSEGKRIGGKGGRRKTREHDSPRRHHGPRRRPDQRTRRGTAGAPPPPVDGPVRVGAEVECLVLSRARL
jgi:formyltetrahydrofolate deformylase